jgi:hypothetical protein
MGRLIFFLIIIAAILAGVWFFVPGGKDMMQGWMGKSDEAATDTTDTDDTWGDDSGASDDTGDAMADDSGDMSGDEMVSDEPMEGEADSSGDEPQP